MNTYGTVLLFGIVVYAFYYVFFKERQHTRRRSYIPIVRNLEPPKSPLRSEPHFDSRQDYGGLVDALTGEAINQQRRLYKCYQCGVLYHEESYLTLQSKNNSKCVSCGSIDLRHV